MLTPRQHVIVLDRLREMILQGDLRDGERLTEAGLADRLGTSRMPVRQALPILSRQGLLVPSGARGYAVRSFSPQECIDAVRLRAALEGLAASSLAERGASDGVLAELDYCLRRGDDIFAKLGVAEEDRDLYAAMNGDFHTLLVESAKNPLLAEMIARCNFVPFVSPATIAFDKVDLRTVYELLSYAHRQHHAIVDAIRARSPGRAEFLLREHAFTQEQSMNFAGLKMKQGATPGSGAVARAAA